MALNNVICEAMWPEKLKSLEAPVLHHKTEFGYIFPFTILLVPTSALNSQYISKHHRDMSPIQAG